MKVKWTNSNWKTWTMSKYLFLIIKNPGIYVQMLIWLMSVHNKFLHGQFPSVGLLIVITGTINFKLKKEKIVFSLSRKASNSNIWHLVDNIYYEK